MDKINNTWVTNNGQLMERCFKFESEDIGKFIVLKFRYQENMFWGNIFGTRLQINNHVLSERNNDYLYAVYEIQWHDDYYKSQNDTSYKIHLKPVGNWGAWCLDRSWYSTDIEHIISDTYNLLEETPVFDTTEEAHEFAIKKNEELYPKKSTIIDKLKKLF